MTTAQKARSTSNHGELAAVVGRLESDVANLQVTLEKDRNDTRQWQHAIDHKITTQQQILLDKFDSVVTRVSDRIDTVESRVSRRDHEIENKIQDKTSTNWQTVGAFVSIALVLSAMGGALITSALGGESNMRAQQVAVLQEYDSRNREVLDMLQKRELEDSYSRGASDEKFNTIKGDLDAAIKNRKDIDAKHVAAQTDLRSRIDEVQHSLDNGLGRRIDEMMDPLKERIISIERAVFRDAPNYRDMDRE